jgi:hypothetical protein
VFLAAHTNTGVAVEASLMLTRLKSAHSSVKKHKLSNGSTGSISIAAMVSQDGTDLSPSRARRLIKELGLVTCQLPKHAYKKVLQRYVAIPNELDRQFNVSAPKYMSGERDETYGNLTDLLPTIAGLFPQTFLNTTLGRDLAWAKNKGLPTYGFSQEERASVMLNSTEIASVNHITGEIKSAFIDEHGKAHYVAQKSQLVEYAQAYHTAAQYLLRANVESK